MGKFIRQCYPKCVGVNNNPLKYAHICILDLWSNMLGQRYFLCFMNIHCEYEHIKAAKRHTNFLVVTQGVFLVTCMSHTCDMHVTVT